MAAGVKGPNARSPSMLNAAGQVMDGISPGPDWYSRLVDSLAVINALAATGILEHGQAGRGGGAAKEDVAVLAWLSSATIGFWSCAISDREIVEVGSKTVAGGAVMPGPSMLEPAVEVLGVDALARLCQQVAVDVQARTRCHLEARACRRPSSAS